jgi:hypothetical protein
MQRAPAAPGIFSPPRRMQENRPAPPAPGTAGGGIFGAPAATASAAPPMPARVGGDDVQRTVRRDMPKVGRNDDCPCGSGKKYKKCHGAGL